VGAVEAKAAAVPRATWTMSLWLRCIGERFRNSESITGPAVRAGRGVGLTRPASCREMASMTRGRGGVLLPLLALLACGSSQSSRGAADAGDKGALDATALDAGGSDASLVQATGDGGNESADGPTPGPDGGAHETR